MAHNCPECDQLCHCGGDIDDICMDNNDTYMNCTHYRECESDPDNDDWDDWDYDYDFADSKKLENNRRYLLFRRKYKHIRRKKRKVQNNRKIRKWCKSQVFFTRGMERNRRIFFGKKAKEWADKVFWMALPF